MTRRDPGTATAVGHYPEPRTCRCGRTELIHHRTASGRLLGVPGAPVPCPGFEPAEAQDPATTRSHQPTPPAAPTGRTAGARAH